MLKAKEAKKNAAAPTSKKEKFTGNAATATVRLGSSSTHIILFINLSRYLRIMYKVPISA